MKKVFYCTSLLLFLGVTLYAQNEIDLSGSIVNQADFPVENMIVTLVGQGLSDTSDSSGEFEILGDLTGITTEYQKPKPNLKLNGSNIILSVPTGGEQVSLEMFNVKGACVATPLPSRVLGEGRHSIPFFQSGSHLSSSVLIAVVKLGSDITKFRIIKTGSRGYMVRSLNGSSGGESADPFLRNPLALDSLKFIRIDSVEFTIPVSKWVDEFEVYLDLIPYEAVLFGVDEFNANRIWPDEVGTTLTEYPHAIKNYLDKTGPGPHDYEWWCSEYYSYALRVGGCPFYSSTSNPSWMIDGNTGIKSWFVSNSEFIEKNAIGDFRPLPGDFCHIEGHSAMVWYIDEKDSLYTVEANGDLDGNGTFDNQMALVNRGYYKNFKDLLGYGRRTGVEGSSWKSISIR